MWKISLQYIQQSNIKINPLWRSQYLPYIYPGLLFSDWFLEWLKVLRSNPIRKTMEDLFLCHLNLQKEGTTVLFKYRKHLPSFDIFWSDLIISYKFCEQFLWWLPLFLLTSYFQTSWKHRLSVWDGKPTRIVLQLFASTDQGYGGIVHFREDGEPGFGCLPEKW